MNSKLQVASILVAWLAAFAWLWSAFIPMPNLFKTKGESQDSSTTIMYKQSLFSAIAALLTSASIVLQAIHLWIG
jgi:hypothetical protein